MKIDLKEAHAEISRRLDRLDFGALLPGFRRFRFALYDESRVCFGGEYLPKDGRFLGNTGIKYDGEYIAIWQLADTSEGYDILAAKLAHEMCHAFQLETGAAFPDEIIGAFYPRDLENFSRKHMENLLLADLVSDFKAANWASLLRLRAARLKASPEAVGYELKAEGIEGQAEYVEFAALKKLSPERHAVELGKVVRRLKKPAAAFDVRLCSYDTGALLLGVAAANGLPAPDWAAGAPAGDAGPAAVPDIAAEFHDYYRGVDRLVADAMSKAEKIAPDGPRLIGFDPYNVRSSGLQLYHPYFIACGETGGELRCSMGKFVTVMKGRNREIDAVYKVRGR